VQTASITEKRPGTWEVILQRRLSHSSPSIYGGRIYHPAFNATIAAKSSLSTTRCFNVLQYFYSSLRLRWIRWVHDRANPYEIPDRSVAAPLPSKTPARGPVSGAPPTVLSDPSIYSGTSYYPPSRQLRSWCSHHQIHRAPPQQEIMELAQGHKRFQFLRYSQPFELSNILMPRMKSWNCHRDIVIVKDRLRANDHGHFLSYFSPFFTCKVSIILH